MAEGKGLELAALKNQGLPCALTHEKLGMDNTESYSFKSVFQFLAYYRECNPARPRYYEKDRYQPEHGRVLDGRDEASWELCCILLDRALSSYHKESLPRRCFEWRYLTQRDMRSARRGVSARRRDLISTEEIAEHLGHHPATIRRWIADVRDHLERVLIDAEVIPPKLDA